jgi:WD40 repeat protein
MSVARAAHSATLLPDGKVLIAGGCTLDSCEMGDDGATAELYDPAKGEFIPTGRMTTERVSHIATLLPNGKVLIAGGFDRNNVLASAELYDPDSGTFSATGSMSAGRSGYSATLLPDGKVLIAGGFDGSGRLSGAELYDPETGTFSATGDMGGRRGEHSAALLPDGRVLVAGGSGGRDEVLASAEVYDPNTGTFRRVSDMTVARRKHAMISLRDGRVLVVGGSDARDGFGQYNSAELFDHRAGDFSATASMAAKRFKLEGALALLSTGEVLVGGGDEQVEVYDPATGVFRTVEGRVGGDLAFATTTALPDGRALIAGGYSPRIKPTAGAWIYDSLRTTSAAEGASPLCNPEVISMLTPPYGVHGGR